MARGFDLSDEKTLADLKILRKPVSFESSKLGVVYNFTELEKSDLKEFISLIKENLKNKDLTLILNSDKKPTKDFSFCWKNRQYFHNFDVLEGAA